MLPEQLQYACAHVITDAMKAVTKAISERPVRDADEEKDGSADGEPAEKRARVDVESKYVPRSTQRGMLV